MKNIYRTLLVGALTLTTLNVFAADFSDCLKIASTRGKIVLVVDDSKLKNASEAFSLLSGLEYINLLVERVQTQSELTYNSNGTPRVDEQGNPVVKTVQEVTAKVVGYNISDFVDQNGMINQDLADEFDESIDTLKQKYPAIIRTECPRIPGPGGRVGG